MYLDFSQYHVDMVISLNKNLSSFQIERFLFGAHIFSQFTIQSGLNTNKISILDNDPNKQGKRLYGSSLRDFSPSILSEENMHLIILKAGQYNEEIKKQILTKINAQATFL